MDPNIAIEKLGGTRAAAAFFEVTDGAVSQWRTSGIPRARAMYLNAVRPDIYEAATSTSQLSELDQEAA